MLSVVALQMASASGPQVGGAGGSFAGPSGSTQVIHFQGQGPFGGQAGGPSSQWQPTASVGMIAATSSGGPPSQTFSAPQPGPGPQAAGASPASDGPGVHSPTVA
jgi:hypothetical protein